LYSNNADDLTIRILHDHLKTLKNTETTNKEYLKVAKIRKRVFDNNEVYMIFLGGTH